MKIKQVSSSRGFGSIAAFSLIEAVVSMGLFGTVAAALLSGFTGGFFTMQMARENQRATQIILEKTETIRLYNWDQVNTPGFIPTSFIATYDPQGTNSPNQIIYNGTLTIANVPINASYSNDMRQVTVTLAWKTGSVNRSRSYTTYIGRNGIQDYVY